MKTDDSIWLGNRRWDRNQKMQRICRVYSINGARCPSIYRWRESCLNYAQVSAFCSPLFHRNLGKKGEIFRQRERARVEQSLGPDGEKGGEAEQRSSDGGHRDWHHELLGATKTDVAAPVQMELPRRFAAQAECQQSISGQKSNRADHTSGRFALRIDIVKFHDVVVAVLHSSL